MRTAKHLICLFKTLLESTPITHSPKNRIFFRKALFEAQGVDYFFEVLIIFWESTVRMVQNIQGYIPHIFKVKNQQFRVYYVLYYT